MAYSQAAFHLLLAGIVLMNALKAHLRLMSTLPVRTHYKREKESMRGRVYDIKKQSEFGRKGRSKSPYK